MFDDMVESTDTRGKTKKPLTIFLSAVFQVAFLAVLLLIPLIYTEALPKTMMATLLVPPPPPPPPPPPVQVVKIKPVAHLIQAGKLVAPKAIPKEVKIIKEEAEPPDMGNVGVTGGVPGGVPGGQAGGVIGGIIGGVVGGPPPPKPKGRTVVGGDVMAARIINRVQPVYPPLARQTRIQG